MKDNELVITNEEVHDCTTCRYGKYNDHWDSSFCYADGDCHDWNLWEKKDDTESLETKLLDAMVSLWVKDDAPEWVKTKVREELAQQRSKEAKLNG